MTMINKYYSNFQPHEMAVESVRASALALATTPEGTPYYCTLMPVNSKQIVENCNEAHNLLTGCESIIIIGMGGAVNNPKAVLSALGVRGVYYLNTTDPDYLANLLLEVDLSNSSVLMISNSGQTTENVAVYSVLLALDPTIAKRSVFMISPKESLLNTIADDYNIFKMPYNSAIGGRFSGFSEVVALPALCAGLDPISFLDAASNLAEKFISGDAQIITELARSIAADKANTVFLGYSNYLFEFGEWYTQVFAESLGKESKGVFPTRGAGPQDQHSTLQLYLEGPNNCFYNIVKVKAVNDFKGIEFKTPNLLSGRLLSDVHAALCDSTVAALEHVGRPLRKIVIDDLSEAAIGELMMFTALEVFVMAGAMQVNPFDQPGVELIKMRTKKILENA